MGICGDHAQSQNEVFLFHMSSQTEQKDSDYFVLKKKFDPEISMFRKKFLLIREFSVMLKNKVKNKLVREKFF